MHTFKKLPTTVPIRKNAIPKIARIGQMRNMKRLRSTRKAFGWESSGLGQRAQVPRMAPTTSSGVLPPVSITASASSR